jgi:hypothetical protein
MASSSTADAAGPRQDGRAPVQAALAGDEADKGRNAEVNFHGQKRSNETHASVTDPDARLYRKGEGKEAKLCYMGHALMENRTGLVVEACLTHADGHAERNAALAMIEPRADRPCRITLGAGWRTNINSAWLSSSSPLISREKSTIRSRGSKPLLIAEREVDDRIRR